MSVVVLALPSSAMRGKSRSRSDRYLIENPGRTVAARQCDQILLWTGAGDHECRRRVSPSDGVLLLKRDLLDQQIIDVHGRKVVRVNDVEIDSRPVNNHVLLEVFAVDVGARGAIRRLSKGLVPSFTLRALLEKIPPRLISWRYVDLLETDPARRVKLKIAYEGLAKLHPADIADIVEDFRRPTASRFLKRSTRKLPPRRSRSSSRPSSSPS